MPGRKPVTPAKTPLAMTVWATGCRLWSKQRRAPANGARSEKRREPSTLSRWTAVCPLGRAQCRPRRCIPTHRGTEAGKLLVRVTSKDVQLAELRA